MDELGSQKTFVLTTKTIKLPKTKNKDEDIVGCLLRISDMQGKIIEEWSSKGPEMKGITWDTKPPEDEIPKPGTGVIR